MKAMWRRFVIGGIMCVMLAIGLMPRERAKGAVPVIDLGSASVSVYGGIYPEVIIESNGVQIDSSITINADANMTVTISNVNIRTSGVPINIYGSGNVTLLLDGTNTLETTEENPVIWKYNSGSLTISSAQNSQTSILNVISNTILSAGIGGGTSENVSDITISGNATVTVNMNGSNGLGAGIGGGAGGSGSNITISDDATVTVNMNGNNCWGAGIGGGAGGLGSNITISDNAKVAVIVNGNDCDGAGIGGGWTGSGSNITISDNAKVDVIVNGNNFDGAGIGGGDGGFGSGITICGNSITAVAGVTLTDAVIEYTNTTYPVFSGDVQYYAPGSTLASIQNGTAQRVNTATITLKANGATGNDMVLTRTIGIPGSLPNDTFTMAGHTITKWNTASNGGGTNYPVNESLTWAGDLTLYAVWSNHVYNQTSTASQYLKSEADCTHAAVYYKSCLCGAKGTDTFTYGNPTGHQFVVENPTDTYLKTPADCTHAAVYYKSCTCGEKGTDSDTFTSGDPTGHQFVVENPTDAYLKTPADCTHAAVYYKSCTCGEKGTETFTYGGPTGHQFVVENPTDTYLKTPADCTQAAVYYKSCTCGEKGTETFIYGNPTGHQFLVENPTDTYLKTLADCTHAAVYYKSCACGEKGTETFTYGDPTGHQFVVENPTDTYLKTPADCTHAAVYYKSCTCGEKGTDNDTFTYGDPTGHQFVVENPTDTYLKTPADCTHAAVYYKSCACGEKGTDNDTFTYGNPMGHDYQNVPGTGTAATCTSSGKEPNMECSRCHDVIQGATIDPIPHSYVLTNTDAQYLKSSADCTHTAVYYKSCACGAKGTETFTAGDPLGHDYQTVAGSGISPTCTSTGKEADRECTRCHAVIQGAVISQLPHTYDRTVVSSQYLKYAADCTDAAVYYKSCECGARGTATFTYGEPLGHDYWEVAGTAKAATCTEEGKKADMECARCHIVKRGATTAKLPHTYDQKVVKDGYLKTAADCTHAAVYYMSCACGEKGTETFTSGKALGHDYKEVTGSAIAATCTAEGKEADTKCTRCGDLITGAVTAKLPHTFDQKTAKDGYLKTAAGCTHAAVYCMSCVCGEKGTETFSYGNALGHDYREVAGTYKAPTCAEDGKKADTECVRCHDMIAGEVIPKTGDHKWKAATGYAPKTCEICGLTEGDVVRYTVESREGLSYKSGEDTAFTITYSRSEDNGSVIDHFERVLIDGQEVKTTTDRSRNSVTVDAETMNALSAGGHTVLVAFNDWEDTLTLTIEAAAKSNDLEVPIAIITAVILAGGLTAAIIVKKRRAI